MSIVSLITRFRASAGRFARADDGNIAILFAITIVPILGLVGAAIDYSRVSNARASMQSALDSTALMLSKDLGSGIIKAADVDAKAKAYFAALFTNKGLTATSLDVRGTYTPRDSSGASTVAVTGSGSMPTDFLRVAGFPQIGLNSASTATWGGTRLRVAMALDVTGSMSTHNKMAAMKKAATDLVTTLHASASSEDDVYISIIPFAQMVNVGASNKDASWIRWDLWEEDNGSCSNAIYSKKSTCRSNGRTWTADNHSTWRGCVTDRDQNYDTTRTVPDGAATQFPAVQYEWAGSNICPAQILPMTSAFADNKVKIITDKIGDLEPNGGTNQPIGLAWAWQSLQAGAPLNAPAKDSHYSYTDVIILLSDGLNTLDRWYGDGNTPSPEIDARQALLCNGDNIKATVNNQRQTLIYTIQVNTDGDAESAILKSCGDKFYPTSTSSGIAGAFSQIATLLSKLRVKS